MKRLVLVLALLAAPLAGALPVRAELPPLIPRKVIFGNPERTQPRLSPDGSRMAYLAPTEVPGKPEGVLNVWVRTVGKQDDRVVTKETDRGIRMYFWAENNRHLLYAQDKGGDENWHVYAVDLTGGDIRDLTPMTGVQARIVASDPDFPDDVLIGLNSRDPRYHDVHRVNLRTGELTLEAQNPGDITDWVADSKLRVRAALASMPDGGFQLRVRQSADSEFEPLITWSSEDAMGTEVHGFTPDDTGLYVSSSIGHDTCRLISVDLASKQEQVLAWDAEVDTGAVLRHPTRRHLQAVSFDVNRRKWKVLDPAVEEDFKLLPTICSGDFSVMNRDNADKTWLVAYTQDAGPVRHYAYHRETRKADFLFTSQPELEKVKLAGMKGVTIPARDGMKLHGYVTAPVGVETKNLPTVLLVHGGPWARDRWGYHPIVQWLANRGYAVLQINFRGSTGFGKKYVNAGDRQWSKAMHDDLIDGVNWAIKTGLADPKKVAIFGGSYGGYATLVGLTFTPDVFACGVDIVGPSNIITLMNSIPPYWEPMRKLFYRRVGDPVADKAFLEECSPLFKADRIIRPLLIGQGANDPRVKLAESDQIYEAMKKNNKEVQYIVFPDEGHGFAKPENRMKFYAAAEAFLAKYLGGRAEPPGEQEKVEIRS